MSLGYNSNRPSRGYGSINSMNNLNAPVPSSNKTTSKKPNASVSGFQSSTASMPAPQMSHSLSKAMSIQDNVIIQRRVEYLETQLKKTQTEFKDHATKLQDFKLDAQTDPTMSGIMYQVMGTADKDIINIENGEKIYNKGDTVHLVYPMKKDGTKTVMRTVRVDPVTAQFIYSWIVVFDMQSGKPNRPVKDFRLA